MSSSSFRNRFSSYYLRGLQTDFFSLLLSLRPSAEPVLKILLLQLYPSRPAPSILDPLPFSTPTLQLRPLPLSHPNPNLNPLSSNPLTTNHDLQLQLLARLALSSLPERFDPGKMSEEVAEFLGWEMGWKMMRRRDEWAGEEGGGWEGVGRGWRF